MTKVTPECRPRAATPRDALAQRLSFHQTFAVPLASRVHIDEALEPDVAFACNAAINGDLEAPTGDCGEQEA